MKNGMILSILSIFRGANSLPKAARFLIYLIIILSGTASIVTSHKTADLTDQIAHVEYSTPAVLGETTSEPTGLFSINIPSVFNGTSSFKGNSTFDGTTTFNGDVKFKNTKLDLGAGQIFASNILYQMTAGNGISVTNGQNPVITNTGVTSLQGSTGAVTLTAGSGITINGTTISSSTSTSQPNTFGTMAISGSSVSAGSTTDTFTFTAGSGITLALNTSTKTLTISGSNAGATAWTDDGTYTYLTTSSESVGIGTSTPVAKLDVQGSLNISGTTRLNGVTYTWPAADGSNGYLLATNASGGLSWVSNSGSTNYWQLGSGALASAQITNDLLVGATATSSALAKFSGTPGGNSFINTGNFGIGSTSPAFKLDVNGDINIASGSTLKINGTTVLSGNTLGAGITASSLTSVGTIATGVWQGTLIGSQYGGTGANLSAAAQGALPYFSATGVMSALAAGTSSQCLIGGTTPSWGSCGGTAWITQLNGALVPINSTLDFLIGGQATSSAKFAVLNIANGTPTASISANSGANATYVTGDGTLATTNRQSLILGSSSTGNISLSPGGTNVMNLTTDGNVGIGTTAGSKKLHVSTTNNADGILINGTTNPALSLANAGTIKSYLGLVTASDAWVSGSVANDTVIRSEAGNILFTTDSGTTSLLTLKSGNGNVGIGTTSPGAKLSLAGNMSVLGTSDAVQQLIKAYSSQSSNISEWQNSSGTVLASINSSGTLSLGGSGGSTTPSYANSGGNGDRTSIITVTSNITFTIGTPSLLVNGNTTENSLYFTGATLDNSMYIKYDFGSGARKVITEAKWYQDTGTSEGVWQWQGSNDNSVWTDIGSTFTLGGSTTQTQTTLSGNSTGYRYYRMEGISGSINNTPYLREIEFKIADETASNSTTTITSSFIGTGTTTAFGSLYISGGTAGQALSVLNYTGTDQNILVGSNSGTLKFAFDKNGNLSLGGSTPSSSNYITAPNFTVTTAGVVTSTGLTLSSGAINLGASNGTSAQCLLGGSTASWGSCGSAATWNINSSLGTITPVNSTLDLLLGGTSTSSAKFAVLNIAGGIATASVSGNMIIMPNVGAGGNLGIGTTSPIAKFNIKGVGNTGIALDSSGGTNTYMDFYESSSKIASVYWDGSANQLNVGAELSSNELILNRGNGNVGVGSTSTTGKLTVTSSYTAADPTAGLGVFVNTANISGRDAIVLIQSGGSSAGDPFLSLNISGEAGWAVGVDNSDSNKFKINPSYLNVDSATAFTIDTGGNIGIGTTSPLSLLHVAGGNKGGRAALILDQTGASTNDIFSASASGSTKFTIGNNGNITATGTLTGLTGLTLSSGAITLGGVTGSGQCLTGGVTASWGICGSAPFSLLSGAYVPGNTTADFLLGATATSSAKFAVLNLAGRTPRASVSGDFIVMPNSGSGTAGGGNVGIGTTAPSAGLEISTNGGLDKPGLLLSGSWLTDGSGNTVNHRPQFLISDPNVVNGFWSTNGTGFGMNAPNGFTGNLIQLNNNGNFRFSIDYGGNLSMNTNVSMYVDSSFSFADANDTTKTFAYLDATNRRVGVGTTSPASVLEVKGTYGKGNALVIFNQTQTGTAADIFTASSSGTTRFKIANNGNVTIIGTPTTCTLGDGAGSTTCSSDVRLKDNIHDLSDSLDKIMRLRPVTFNWKKAPERNNIGFIAQEVQPLFPEMVRELGDGYLGLDYANLVVPAIKAIQEQQGEINTLKATLGASNYTSSNADLSQLNITVNQVTLDVQNLKDKTIAGQSEVDGLAVTLNEQESTIASHSSELSELKQHSDENTKDIASLSNKLDKLGALSFVAADASLSGDLVTVKEGLLVLGTATLNEASVATYITVANNLTIEPNSINTLSGDLDIQSLKQGAISFMSSAVRIETDGTVKFMENVAFEKNVTVAGVLGVKSINLTRDTYTDLTDTESLASASAGTTTITGGQTKRILKNNLIKSDSLIYVTPIGKTFGETPYVSDQKDGQITITIDNAVVSPIKLNFLIINTQDNTASNSGHM